MLYNKIQPQIPALVKVFATWIVAAILAPITLAETNYTGSITMTSDYVWRGVSQTSNRGAVQGGFEYNLAGLGIVAGLWGSSVYVDPVYSIGLSDPADPTSDPAVIVSEASDLYLEVDLYAGLDFAVGANRDIGFRMLYTEYRYPGASSAFDFDEYSVSLDLLDLHIDFVYSEDYLASGEATTWLYVDYTLPVFGFDLRLGTGMAESEGNIFGGSDSYTSYTIGLGFSTLGINFGVDLQSTNLDESSDFCANSICDTTTSFYLSKSF